MRVMFGRVDNAQLLEMIVTRYNGQDILGLRKLLSRAFGNCSLEREFLKAEESSVQDEVDKKVEEGQMSASNKLHHHLNLASTGGMFPSGGGRAHCFICAASGKT